MRCTGLLCAVALLLASLLLVPRPARAADDPKLLWKQIETAHFRVSYYSTEDEIAAHVATVAEGIYARLVPAVGWTPSERTEIAIVDQTESANGITVATPYNAIVLYATAPDDMSPLGDVDDWYLELVTHEYTHILHTDHITGFPALINRIFGKVYAPNQLAPRWLLEGLAVFEESARTSGGRLRSSMWNMFMRADVLEDNVAPLDVFSNSPRRWPGGNIWYLYGSFFMRWIAETYGEIAIRHMIDDYGGQVVPYALNRSIRRATGRTFEELYPAWIDSFRRSFGAQADAIRARGLREGTRLTHTGYSVQHPRWVPASTWPEHAGDLLYFADDGHTTPGVWALPLARDARGAVAAGDEGRRELVIRTSGTSVPSFLPDGTAVFSSTAVTQNLFGFNDLFELPPHAKSPSGFESSRVRWTEGYRALDPSVSPDGRQVVFTTNHRGTTYLMIGDIVPAAGRVGAHALTHVHGLVQTPRFDQVYTPRWARDGRHVAYSAWSRGGYRDVRIVDTADGSVVDVTHDRAIDGGPSYSPDGRFLFFHSDRTGVMNVYAYEVATGAIRQVTNVLTGAYQPEPSPDGKTLAYVGYTHEGYDVFVLPLDEGTWLDAPATDEPRPAPPPEPPPIAVTPRPYDPLPTLVPRSYSVSITPGNFGQASIVTANGSDIAGLHAISANITTEWEQPDFQGSIGYSYGRLPFDVGLSAYRVISPGSGFRLGSDALPWVAETVGATTDISYAIRRPFDSQSFNLSYSFARIGGNLALPTANLDPYRTPSLPFRGYLGSLHLGWSYANSEGWLYSVSQEKGWRAGLSLDIADDALASEFSGYSARADVEVYYRMPWLRHHVLALHLGGGASGGDRAGRGSFFVGGWVDYPVIDTVRNNLVQAGWIVLRGYPVAAETGAYYALLNSEYRFPIVNVDRGPSTLPIFLQRISGTVFFDYGSAFDATSNVQPKAGVGAELWLDVALGYVLGFTFRAGYARGVSSGGIDKTYFVAVYAF
ncbi:MAG: PD40 domain-containing protein [Myxococcales bacterium]|nr:PD40 domain-containing protein [Myxococcales bacterium]